MKIKIITLLLISQIAYGQPDSLLKQREDVLGLKDATQALKEMVVEWKNAMEPYLFTKGDLYETYHAIYQEIVMREEIIFEKNLLLVGDKYPIHVDFDGEDVNIYLVNPENANPMESKFVHNLSTDMSIVFLVDTKDTKRLSDEQLHDSLQRIQMEDYVFFHNIK